MPYRCEYYTLLYVTVQVRYGTVHCTHQRIITAQSLIGIAPASRVANAFSRVAVFSSQIAARCSTRQKFSLAIVQRNKMGVEGLHCVVTGGSGFVGSRLVEMLVERGAASVKSFDLAGAPEFSKPDPKVTFVQGNITDPKVGVELRQRGSAQWPLCRDSAGIARWIGRRC